MAAQLISSVPQSARAPLHPRCTPHRREHAYPPATAANDGPPNPRMGPISGQTLARQAGLAQAWQRYPHPLPVFGSQTWFVPLFPRACNLSRAALSMSTVRRPGLCLSCLFCPFPRPKPAPSPLLSCSCSCCFSSASSEFEFDQTRVLGLRKSLFFSRTQLQQVLCHLSLRPLFYTPSPYQP